jgi:hypothetical protein
MVMETHLMDLVVRKDRAQWPAGPKPGVIWAREHGLGFGFPPWHL